MDNSQQRTFLQSTVRQMGTGGLSGAAATAFTFPLDVLKTRYQSVSSSTMSKGLITHFKSIYKTEGGFRAFFKGFCPSTTAMMISSGIYFCSYNECKTRLGGDNGNKLAIFLAGTTANFTSTMLTLPIWGVKSRMQLSRAKKQSMVYHFRDVWKNHGIKGFYRATPTVCIGSVKEGGYFVIYEQLKQCLPPHIDEHLPTSATIMITSGTARVVSTTIFYPFEVTRTRLFEDGHKRFLQALSEVWKEKQLYTGFHIQLIKTVPHTMVTFFIYELLKIMHSNCIHNIH